MSQDVRCAIYTRKSTDEGLEQEFNTLDAQRESAEAFITSQRSEGWVVLPEHYDDGGFTGGNLERPALKRLLDDVAAGRIDCVVVYKVDRLSRSLLDFSRLMEVFDKHKVSFVSVTQQFNTTHSMGRLTLNILLSFAQFEREIIVERTKDKVYAARRKGKWTGGMPVLGYDVAPEGGRLLVNEEEAEQVRGIFQIYLDKQSLIATIKELEERGWATKRWKTRSGHERGGKAFKLNSLHRLLTNPIFTGQVVFQGAVYEGEHKPIVDLNTWQATQRTLHGNFRRGPLGSNRYGALLRGLLYCSACGTAMIHTCSKRDTKTYRYYVCLTAQQRGWHQCPSKSLNAHDIETAVVEHIKGIGLNPAIISAVTNKATEKAQRNIMALEAEHLACEREIKKLTNEIRKLTEQPIKDARDPALAKLAEAQQALMEKEQRMTLVKEEVRSIQHGLTSHDEVGKTLQQFEPLWDTLTTQEKIKIIRLLVERVGFDGRDNSVTVTFRSQDIKELCSGQAAGR